MMNRASRSYALSLRAVISWSTLLGLFSEAARYKAGVDIKAFYFVMLFNTLVLLSLGSFFINKPLVLFYTYLIFSGLVSIAAGTNTIRAFSEQFLGITFTSLYFYNFLRFENFDFRRLFLRYTLALHTTCAGLAFVMVPFQRALLVSQYRRAHSV